MFSAVLLILQALKIKFDVAYVNEIFTAVLGLLVVIGIIIDPTKTVVKPQENDPTEKEKVENEKVEDVKNQDVKPLPVVHQNETDNVHFQNDFQTLVTEIKSQINQTMEELKQMKKQDDINKISEPSVEEISNPYVDVIN